jgi:hypothetical protein
VRTGRAVLGTLVGVLLAAGPAAVADGDAGSADAPTSVSAADYAGTWAQLRVLSAIVDIPVLGEVTVTTTAVLRLTMTGEGRRLSIDGEACSLDQEMSTSLLRSAFPEALVRYAGRFTTSASLRAEDGEIRFFQPRRWMLFGARLEDPEHDALPTEAEDERVVDADRDGRPGVTVRFSGLVNGDVWLVQRQWSTMRGTVDGERIDGSIQWGEERAVLGATSVMLESQPPSRANPDAAASYFRMTRVETGDDCASILARRDTLFAR